MEVNETAPVSLRNTFGNFLKLISELFHNLTSATQMDLLLTPFCFLAFCTVTLLIPPRCNHLCSSGLKIRKGKRYIFVGATLILFGKLFALSNNSLINMAPFWFFVVSCSSFKGWSPNFYTVTNVRTSLKLHSTETELLFHVNLWSGKMLLHELNWKLKHHFYI